MHFLFISKNRNFTDFFLPLHVELSLLLIIFLSLFICFFSYSFFFFFSSFLFLIFLSSLLFSLLFVSCFLSFYTLSSFSPLSISFSLSLSLSGHSRLQLQISLPSSHLRTSPIRRAVGGWRCPALIQIMFQSLVEELGAQRGAPRGPGNEA